MRNPGFGSPAGSKTTSDWGSSVKSASKSPVSKRNHASPDRIRRRYGQLRLVGGASHEPEGALGEIGWSSGSSTANIWLATRRLDRPINEHQNASRVVLAPASMLDWFDRCLHRAGLVRIANYGNDPRVILGTRIPKLLASRANRISCRNDIAFSRYA